MLGGPQAYHWADCVAGGGGTGGERRWVGGFSGGGEGLGGSPCGWKGAVGTTLKKETPPQMGKRGAVETTAKKRGVTEPPPQMGKKGAVETPVKKTGGHREPPPMGGRGLLGDEWVIMPFLGQEGGQRGSPPILGNKGMQPPPRGKIEGGNGEDCLSWRRSRGTRTPPPTQCQLHKPPLQPQSPSAPLPNHSPPSPPPQQ